MLKSNSIIASPEPDPDPVKNKEPSNPVRIESETDAEDLDILLENGWIELIDAYLEQLLTEITRRSHCWEGSDLEQSVKNVKTALIIVTRLMCRCPGLVALPVCGELYDTLLRNLYRQTLKRAVRQNTPLAFSLLHSIFTSIQKLVSSPIAIDRETMNEVGRLTDRYLHYYLAKGNPEVTECIKKQCRIIIVVLNRRMEETKEEEEPEESSTHLVMHDTLFDIVDRITLSDIKSQLRGPTLYADDYRRVF